MIQSSQLEQQLSAIAMGVDRANRPTSLLTIPMVLLLVALGYAGWGYREMSRQRDAVNARVRDVQEINRLVSQIQSERTKTIDIASLYDKLPFMGSQIEQSWKDPSLSFREPPQVSGVTSNQILSNPVILRSEVQVTSNNEPLENILRGVDATLKHEFLTRRAFVSLAQLTPSPTGWRSTIRFSAYHVPSQ